VLDEITKIGSSCTIQELKIGESVAESSYALIKVRSKTQKRMDNLIANIKTYGAEPVTYHAQSVEIQGHIVDSLTLSKILDIIVNYNSRCEVQEIKIGIDRKDLSFAKIKIISKNQEITASILKKIAKHGAVPVH